MRTSALRRPSLSDNQPEKTFTKLAVVSATPSTTPTSSTLAPSVPVRKSGSTTIAISVLTSVKKLTAHRAHTVRGIRLVLVIHGRDIREGGRIGLHAIAQAAAHHDQRSLRAFSAALLAHSVLPIVGMKCN